MCRQDFVFTKHTYYVCDKHFNEDDILNCWCSGPFKIPYKRWRLVEGAIPTIFYGISYINKIYVEPRKIRKSDEQPVLNVKSEIFDEKIDTSNNEDNLFQSVQNIKFESPWLALPITKDNIEF